MKELLTRLLIPITILVTCIILIIYFSDLIITLTVAVFVAYLLKPIVDRIQFIGINRIIAIIIVFLSIAAFTTYIWRSIVPVIGKEISLIKNQLTQENLNKITNMIEHPLTDIFDFIPPNFIKDNILSWDTIGSFLGIDSISEVSSQITTVLDGVLSFTLNLIIIFFACFFFLKDGHRFRRTIIQNVPNKYFETTIYILSKIENQLSTYFRSILLQSFIVFLLSTLFLTIAGMKNAWTLGLTIGLANTIPYFGPVIGYVFAFILSIFQTGDFSLSFQSMLAVLSVQLIDNFIIQPLIFSRATNLHPMIILITVLIGAKLGGIIGMLLALPIATTIKVSFEQIQWSIRNYSVFFQTSSSK